MINQNPTNQHLHSPVDAGKGSYEAIQEFDLDAWARRVRAKRL
jgi:hypothetical protein